MGAGIEPQVFLDFNLANKFARANHEKLLKTLTDFKKRQNNSTKTDLLRKTHLESRQALMPQVRIRNVSNEYKLVAGVFSPELLRIEERRGKQEVAMTLQENDCGSTSTLKKMSVQS